MLSLIAKKRKPQNTSAWVAETIQEAIFAGTLKPGDRLVEGKLAKDLGVGVSPVREALQRLEYLGLVTRYPNRGTFVTQLTPTEINQIFRLRAELETLSVKFAIEGQNREGLSDLRECAEQMMRASLEKNPAKFFEWDLKFHHHVCRMANNPFLEKCLRTLTTPLFAFVLIRLKREPELFDLIDISKQHQQIVELFELPDPAQAEQRMRTIMDGFRQVMLDKLYDSADAGRSAE
ncbi:MAG: GntR family transcriptional regulator [Acidobacteria bacterium]|nr:MAG: GntR family transcriptional regulator [Acidobacteriota bacterium]